MVEEIKYSIGLFTLMLLICSGLILMACGDDNASSSDLGPVNQTFQWGAANPTYLSAEAVPSEVIDPSGVGVGGTNDGEVIVFGGKALATDSTGEVHELSDDDSIVVSGVTTNFQPTYTTVTTETIGCQDDLDDYLNDVVGDDEVDRLATFTIRGNFSSIDYVVEKGVSEDSTLFNVENVSGTMVGIKSPYYFGDDTFVIDNITVGVAEYPYHVHFVTDDETVVGHIRECEIDPGSEVEIALVNIFDLQMNYGD